MVCVTKHTKT